MKLEIAAMLGLLPLVEMKPNRNFKNSVLVPHGEKRPLS